MGRFSVDKNIVSNATSNLLNVTEPTLVMPDKFDRHIIALDRDGVVCECNDSITGPEKFVPIENAFKAVALIRSKGHKVVFLYDQPGISQKKVTIEQVEICNKHMLMLLGQAGCTSIDGIWYNTSSRKDDLYAKPNLGLFKHAEANVPGAKLEGGVYVGDSLDDLIMADAAKATPVLVLTGNGKKTLEKLDKTIFRMLKPKVKVFNNLMEFAKSL